MHVDVLEDRIPLEQRLRLKINFVDVTYPKGWTESLPLCPLIFSWFHLCCIVVHLSILFLPLHFHLRAFSDVPQARFWSHIPVAAFNMRTIFWLGIMVLTKRK